MTDKMNRKGKIKIALFNIASIIVVLELIAALVFAGYEFGLYQAKKETGSKIHNEWFWEHEGRPQVYREGFMKLPKAQRDSLYLDAIDKMR